MSAAERTRLVREGVARAASRLDRVEERMGGLDKLAFEVGELARRVEALERAAWLPNSGDLQRRRLAAIRRLRAQGLSITVIAEEVGMSRGRVGAIVAGLPCPETVVAADGRSYPARAIAEHRRRTAAASNGARP